MNQLDNINGLINDFILCCRDISKTYKKEIANNSNPTITLSDCERTDIRIANYASLLNKRLKQDFEKNSIRDHELWRMVLEPHIINIAMDQFSSLGDLHNPVLIKRSPPDSKFVYEINITMIYIMCNDNDTRRKFLYALINIIYHLFEEHQVQLRDVREKYRDTSHQLNNMV